MPGSGYIAESGPKPATRASATWVGTSDYGDNICRQNKMLFPFYRNSFRSGSAYDIFGSKKGNEVHMNEPTLYEGLLAISGTDLGHNYTKKCVTEIKSSFRNASNGSIPHIGYNTLLPRTFFIPESDGSPNAYTALNSYALGGATVVSDSDLVAQGTRLFAATNPLKPPLTLATSLTELMFEGLPAIIGKTILTPTAKKREHIKMVGGEHLNFMFGVTPVWSDIVGLVKTIRQGDKLVRQWLKNDGRKIRRRRSWEVSTTERFDRTMVGPYLQYSALIPSEGPERVAQVSSGGGYIADGFNGWLESSLQTRIQYSFATSFEYTLSKLLPDYPDWFSSMLYGSASDKQIAEQMLIQHQFGLDPKTIVSADTVWNTLPFSWLLDWFVNIGDLVSNVTAIKQNGLVCDYGYMSAYVERRYIASYRFTHAGSVFDGTSALTGVYHRRIRATPFGFGSTFDGLSPAQTSILAALATSLIR